MTTKNLSRTIIEGGRTGYYKARVSRLASEERAKNRTFLRSTKLDPEEVWEGHCAPRRRPAEIDFADKLTPMYRFMDARVGRPWDAVRSELFKKFDARTTPGRHALFDHLLRSVCQDPGAPEDAPHRRYATHFVDTWGRLQKVTPRWNRDSRRSVLPSCDLAAVASWLAGKKIGAVGSKLFWFVPARGQRVVTVAESGALICARADECGKPIRDPAPALPPGVSLGYFFHQSTKPRLRRADTVAFRQSSALSDSERAKLHALPAYVQKKIFELSTARSATAKSRNA